MILKRKWFRTVMCLTALLGLTTVYTAGEAAAEEAEGSVIESEEFGIRFETPEKYRNLEGLLDLPVSFPEDDIMAIEVQYYALHPEQVNDYMVYQGEFMSALAEEEEPPEAPVTGWMSGYEKGTLFNIYSVKNRSEEELREYLEDNNGIHGDNFAWMEEVGRDGDTVFYVAQYAQLEEEKDRFRENMGGLYDEFVSLYTDKDLFLGALTMSEPEWPAVLGVGSRISFATTDLDGNVITSSEIFAGHKVTMINIWATWCGPCVGELPELAEMAEDFEAQGCRIIGICHDADQEGKAQEALSILAEAGADYLNIAAPEGVDEMFAISAFPTSYFVDSEGKLLLEPVIGADPDWYPQALAQALAIVE